MTMAISAMVLTIVALMFVDDGNFPTLARDKDESMASVMERHQHMVDDWSGALGTSGGALKPSKCFCSPVVWQWKSGKATIAPAAATRRITWTAFWGTLWAKLRYPLAALTFSEKEWGQLMKPMFRALLPMLGVVSTSPLAFRYAPIKYFGLGLPDGYLEQTIAKVNHLIQHGPIASKAGEVGRALIKNTQMEIWVGTQFFQLSYKQWGRFAMETWSTTVWREVAPLPMMIMLRDAAILPLQHEHDEYLMEPIMAVRGFSGDDAEGINRARISAQVYSLADVTTGDGTKIQRRYLDDRGELKPSKLT